MSEAISPAPRALWRRILPRRVSTWLMTIWTAVCGLWLVAGISAASGDDASGDCVRVIGRKACDDAGDTGSAIGVLLIIVLWAIVLTALGVVALVTRKRA